MPKPPTRRVLRDHLARKGLKPRFQRDWAEFLHGLDWKTIRPLVQISVTSRVHPAIAAAKVAEFTQDEDTRALLQGHIRTKVTRMGDTTPNPQG